MTTRRKFSAEFKSKVALESWESGALKNLAQVFSKEKASSSSNTVDTQVLYAQIGVDYTPIYGVLRFTAIVDLHSRYACRLVCI